ncbi:MAG: acyloxyacyl hydrolase [Parvularcula sp.]
MRSLKIISLAVPALFSWAAAVATAGEVRVGIAKHDITDTEDGADIQGQITFDTNWFGFLDSYVVAQGNTEGSFNAGGAGLMVQTSPARKWFAELQFGLVVHDGRVKLPPPDVLIDGSIIDPADVGNPDVEALLLRRRVLDTEKTYGCKYLFQTQPAIGRHLNDRWSTAVYWEHLSHGQILCDSGKNEGVDNIGVRLSRRF